MRLILGSSSHWRADVLRRTGVPFEVVVPDIDEKAIRDSNPAVLTMRIAEAKARKVLTMIEGPALVITSDQVVVKGGVIREKPASADEARAFLRSYSSSSCSVVTGVAVASNVTGEIRAAVDLPVVYFKRISDEAIEAAINEGLVMHSCGGLVYDAPTMRPYVDRVVGDLDSVEGLPLRVVRTLLAHFNYTLP